MSSAAEESLVCFLKVFTTPPKKKKKLPPLSPSLLCTPPFPRQKQAATHSSCFDVVVFFVVNSVCLVSPFFSGRLLNVVLRIVSILRGLTLPGLMMMIMIIRQIFYTPPSPPSPAPSGGIIRYAPSLLGKRLLYDRVLVLQPIQPTRSS